MTNRKDHPMISYDDLPNNSSAQRATFDYHRNGVAGVGFYVRATIHGLHVQFGSPDVGDVHTVDATWDDIRDVVDNDTVRGGPTGWVTAVDVDSTRMVAIAHTSSDMAVALFDPTLLPNVAFGFNSWRGDRHADVVWARIRRHVDELAAEVDGALVPDRDAS